MVAFVVAYCLVYYVLPYLIGFALLVGIGYLLLLVLQWVISIPLWFIEHFITMLSWFGLN